MFSEHSRHFGHHCICLALTIGLLSEFIYCQVLMSEAVHSFYLLILTEPHKFPVSFDSPYEE